MVAALSMAGGFLMYHLFSHFLADYLYTLNRCCITYQNPCVFNFLIFCYCRSSSSILSYEVNVIPRFNFPAIFLERIIRSDLPVNLRALACRAERILEGNQASIDGSLNGKDNLLTLEFKDSLPTSNFVPLTPSSSELNIKWGILGKTCSLDRQCMVDEVHLRRFDGLLVIC